MADDYSVGSGDYGYQYYSGSASVASHQSAASGEPFNGFAVLLPLIADDVECLKISTCRVNVQQRRFVSWKNTGLWKVSCSKRDMRSTQVMKSFSTSSIIWIGMQLRWDFLLVPLKWLDGRHTELVKHKFWSKMLPEDKLELCRYMTIVDGRPLQVMVNGSKETAEICIVFSGKPIAVSWPVFVLGAVD